MIIEKIFEDARKVADPQNGKRYWFRPSEAGDCRRSIAYARLGYEKEEKEDERQLLLQDGHMHGNDLKDRLSRTLKGKNGFHSPEQEFERTIEHKGVKVTVKGHVDGLLGTDGIVEFKGISHFTFKDLVRTREVRKSYILQLTLYIWLSKRKWGIFLIKDKNNSHLFEQKLDFDPQLIKWCLDRFAEVEKALQKKKLPDRDFALGSKECYQCDFFKECWKGSTKKITESFGKDSDKIIEITKKEDKGFYEMVEQYEAIKDDIDQAETKKEKLRQSIISSLAEYKAKKARLEDFTISYTKVIRMEADKNKIKKLISEGLIKTVEKTTERLEVNRVKGED